MPDIPFDASLSLIDGRWRAGESGQTLALENPSDGSGLTHIARGTAADIDTAVYRHGRRLGLRRRHRAQVHH